MPSKFRIKVAGFDITGEGDGVRPAVRLAWVVVAFVIVAGVLCFVLPAFAG